MWISLCEMKVGDTGRVVDYEKSFLSYRQKLLSMGLTPGTEFTVIRIAPLGDPVEIRVRGTDLSLRQNEVAALRIERLDSELSNQSADQADEEVTVAVIGNPNCGKTTLFNGLTGARQHVGNWAGVTVEQKTGLYRYDDKVIKVVDLLDWSFFMVTWSTGLAYLTATVFYQLATYNQHPGVTVSWLIGAVIVCTTVVLVFRNRGKRHLSAVHYNRKERIDA